MGTISIEGLTDGQMERIADTTSDPSSNAEYDREWGNTVLLNAIQHLRDEYREVGNEEVFCQLLPLWRGTGSQETYERVALHLGMQINAVRVAVSRLRRRLLQHLQEEIAPTVDGPREAEQELKHLFQVIASN